MGTGIEAELASSLFSVSRASEANWAWRDGGDRESWVGALTEGKVGPAPGPGSEKDYKAEPLLARASPAWSTHRLRARLAAAEAAGRVVITTRGAIRFKPDPLTLLSNRISESRDLEAPSISRWMVELGLLEASEPQLATAAHASAPREPRSEAEYPPASGA